MIGASIKKGFSVTRKSLGLLAVLFVFGLVWNLINLFYAQNLTAAEPNIQESIIILALGLVFILISIFIQGGSLGYVLDVVKQGKSAFSNFTAAGKKYYGRLFVLGLIVSLFLIVLFAAIMLAATFLMDKTFALAVTITVFLATVVICFVVLVFLAPYIMVVDEQKAVASIKKSIVAVRKNLLPLLGVSLLLILIGFGVGLVLGGIQAGLSYVLKQETATKLIFAVLGSLANSYLGVLVTATFMSFYLALQNSNNNN